MAKEWKPEEQVLTKTTIKTANGYIYPWCSEFSRDEKIEFIDKYASKEDLATYVLNLSSQFEKDKENMPLDKWGKIKTVSLKAWIKKNDNRNIIDYKYHYGEIHCRYLNRFIQHINEKGIYEKFDDFIDQMFYILLQECLKAEKDWFKEHDEYSVLLNTVVKKAQKYGYLVPMIMGSNTLFSDGSGDFNGRMFTIKELKELNEKYDMLEQYIEDLKNSISFSFDQPAE